MKQTRTPSNETTVSTADEALLVKILSYDLDMPKAIREHCDMAIEKLRSDTEARDCFLTPQDTVDIVEHGKKIRVLEPQCFECVTTLDSSSYMFENQGDDDTCRGLFYEFDGKAVSGSGCDVWYKATPSLVAFCRRLECEIASFSSDDDHVRILKGTLEHSLEKVVELEKEEKRFRLIAEALRNEKESEIDAGFEIRRKMGAVLAGKRKRGA